MAKVYKNDKNFLVIQMTGEEASNLDFGVKIPGLLNSITCGCCNDSIEYKDIYYIASNNEIACKDCCDDYVNNMSHYMDDNSINYEINHFNIIAQKLGMSEKAAITPDNKIIITI